jgi:excinuclease ABC subunit C
LMDLMHKLPILKSVPKRIECYDISNISGKEAVGSMVVALDGNIAKSEYKRFKIKLKQKPDDFEMINEVISRRLVHHPDIQTTKNQKWPVPYLLLIDGGKGQVSSALEALEKANISIPVAGLIKKEEILVYKQEENFVEIAYDKKSLGLNLLIKLRDEAHRFAQDYHHKLRSKNLFLP